MLYSQLKEGLRILPWACSLSELISFVSHRNVTNQTCYLLLLYATAIVLCTSGNATKAPCSPNFIYVSMREIDTAQGNSTNPPTQEPEEPECGSAKVSWGCNGAL